MIGEAMFASRSGRHRISLMKLFMTICYERLCFENDQ
jgi:hypothetical protein